ncbi:MAG: VCBS repeat-containing protein [Deltaproteobacteria bacterium]|nr:VCBS repeat-containing protein [Deltaproteobacteria bacterium]
MLVPPACGDDSAPSSTACERSSDCSTGQSCVDGVCRPTPAPDANPSDAADTGTPPDLGPPILPDTGPFRCTSDEQCGTGFCVEGDCCPTAEQVCGTACCGAGETCFASACVVPGRECRTSMDCDEGQYCEPALAPDSPVEPDAGPADGGAPTDAGVPATDAGSPPDAGSPMDAATPDSGPAPVCLDPGPPPGRCLALPPRCEGDEPMPGESCIRDCEYRPPTAPLDAVREWTWGPTAAQFPNHTDVWATPTVGRVADTNCDGLHDLHDAPNIVFVAGNAGGTCCSCGDSTSCLTGVLRVLDGRTGAEVWSLRRAAMGSIGFAGLSVALADVDGDGGLEIFAMTGEGRVALVDGDGTVLAVSAERTPGYDAASFGWGGGLAVADTTGDGSLEIAYGRTVFRWDGTTLARLWIGTGGIGRAHSQALSFFVNLDDTPALELLAGRTAYRDDGTILWDRTDIPEGFSAVGDLDRDGVPEVAVVSDARCYVLDGVSGETELGPTAGSGTGNGGPPTVADFDGDGFPEIGMATQNYYEVLKADYDAGELRLLWESPNHDFSSSVTGSTVFDFEGDGAAEVVYNDECFLWVYDGATGAVRFATPTTSFTATEASLVADVDGDGAAEVVMVSNGASPDGWRCTEAPWTSPDGVRPAWIPPEGGPAYRGISVFGDRTGSWVGTRTLWNQHAYSVSNVCDDRDDACDPARGYGRIPETMRDNWDVPWLNNFRQNVQDQGLFDAPDAVVTLAVQCHRPLRLVASVRNLGEALLPAGVVVRFYQQTGASMTLVGEGSTTAALFPGQVERVSVDAPADAPPEAAFVARIEVDEATRTFHECREDNNSSEPVVGRCLI